MIEKTRASFLNGSVDKTADPRGTFADKLANLMPKYQQIDVPATLRYIDGHEKVITPVVGNEKSPSPLPELAQLIGSTNTQSLRDRRPVTPSPLTQDPKTLEQTVAPVAGKAVSEAEPATMSKGTVRKSATQRASVTPKKPTFRPIMNSPAKLSTMLEGPAVQMSPHSAALAHRAAPPNDPQPTEPPPGKLKRKLIQGATPFGAAKRKKAAKEPESE